MARINVLLLALLLSGCQGQTTGVRPVVLIAPDSVRWVQEEKDTPYALIWQNGTVNLWVQQESWITGPDYPYPVARYRYSAVCRGRVSPYYLASGDLVTTGDLDNCTVNAGSFSLELEGDSLWRGLVTTTVAVPNCGERTDTLWLRLARVPTTEGS